MKTEYTLKFYEGHGGIGIRSFDDDENSKLDRVVTNSDKNVYAWKISDAFSQENAGALLSRYSRTASTARDIYLKEFYPNINKGREFYQAWLLDYGDDSIQEMVGGLPVSFEYVSNLAAKEIEDSRFASAIEKSSRYVPFDKKLPNGQYMFYTDKDIMESRFGDAYLSVMNGLFDSYSRHISDMSGLIEEKNPIEEVKFSFSGRVMTMPEFTLSGADYGLSEKDLVKAYNNSVRANALDLLRDYLPMSTLTHVGISANARVYDGILTKMFSSPLGEARWLAENAYGEIYKLAPSVINGIKKKHGEEAIKFLMDKRDKISLDGILEDEKPLETSSLSLFDYPGRGSMDPDAAARNSLLSVILYTGSYSLSLQDSSDVAAGMSKDRQDKVISDYVGNRTNRRQRPGRAFESLYYVFDIKNRVGIYRDLQRHRVGTQQRKMFSTDLGYSVREQFAEIGIDEDYREKMGEVTDLFNSLRKTLPYQAQYAVTFGFNVRWYININARELFHICELRTTPQGHPDYRKVAQDMARVVENVNPSVTKHMYFLNKENKELGRLGSEIRMAVKKSALNG